MYQMIYTHCAIKSVNKTEEKYNNQKKRISTSLIKVSGLYHNMQNKLDPDLAWIMFHNIDNIFHKLNHK